MKKTVLSLIVGIITLAAAVMFTPIIAFQVGSLEARLDLLQGKRRVKRCWDFCVQAGPLREWEATLKREFDVEMVVVPPCLRNEARHEQVRGYNAQQSEEAERIFGKAKIEEEGRKSYEGYLLNLEAEAQ